MNTLLEMLLAFGPLNRNELSLLKKNIKQLSLNTDDFYLQAGEISKDIAFIETGVLRLFYFDKNGQDFTLQFLKSKTFIVETNSFENKIPTSEYIQCLTKSTLSVLTSEALFNFSK
ncbi:MAG TPA: cyclic nucleotide-binding domain-containing protein, partial [Chitinophagaceae bacterium]|nr:cyclic nucleotide-binding domain-containing protein [Chitinophagaceae bacterium]